MSWLANAAPERVDALRRRLETLDRICPVELVAGDADCSMCQPEDREKVDAIVRAHRRRRVELPMVVLRHASMGHGSALIHGSIRRFAWFVPALFVSCFDPSRTASPLGLSLHDLRALAIEAYDAERIYHADAPRDFSREEHDAIHSCFEAALLAYASTPSGEGIEALDLLDAAGSFRCRVDALVDAWLDDTAKAAEEHLLAAIGRMTLERSSFAMEALARESVRAELERRFLGAEAARAEALSRAEERLASILVTDR